MVHPERFERPTLWFVARYSIQLSYGCGVNHLFKQGDSKLLQLKTYFG